MRIGFPVPSVRGCGVLGWCALLGIAAAPGGVRAQPGGGCEPQWQGPFSAPGVAGISGPLSNENVVTTAVYDPDGPGGAPPLIIAGGTFVSAGGQTAPRVAAWDGQTWSAMGALSGTVRCVFVFDDDGPSGPHAPALYVGGSSLAEGDIGLLRWDPGSGAWTTDGIGIVTGEVYCMTTLRDTLDQPPALCIAGTNPRANGGTLGGAVLRWDGAQWTAPFPTSQGFYYAPVRAIGALDHDGPGPGVERLYAAGLVDSIGVCVWTEGDWTSITSGPIPRPIGDAYAMTTFDDDGPAGPHPAYLVVGGALTSGGVWKWNPTDRWSTVGAGFNSLVYSVGTLTDPTTGAQTLFAGGMFASSGGMPVQSLAQWTGTGWTALGLGILGGSGPQRTVASITAFNDEAYGGPSIVVGGKFLVAGGMNCNSIAVWNRTEWISLSGAPPVYPVAAAVHDFGASIPGGPTLVVSGNPTAPGAPPQFPVPTYRRGVRRTSVGWMPVLDLPLAYAFAHLERAGSTSADAPIDLYAGGFFGVIDHGTACTGIARYDGTSWRAMGVGVNDAPGGPVLGALVNAIASFRPGPGQPVRIVAGGEFELAGGSPALCIASYDGVQWSAMGAGLGLVSTGFPAVNAVVVFDEDGPGPRPETVYAGGLFDRSGPTVLSNNVARWDQGTGQWQRMGAGLGGSTGAQVAGLAVYDDDGPAGPNLPALYACGTFTASGTAAVALVARWDTSAQAWQPVGDGTGPVMIGGANTMMVVDEDGPGGPAAPALFVAGGFSPASGPPAPRIAKWDGQTWTPVEPVTPNPVITVLLQVPPGGSVPLGDSTPGLYAMGYALPSGWNFAAPFMAKWGGCPRCAADFDADDTITPADVARFVQVWYASLATGTPGGDFDHDGTVGAADVAAFVQAWLGALTNGC